MGVEEDCVCSTPKVFVGQIPSDLTRESLSSLFEAYGRVNRIDMLTPRQLTVNTRSAMIWFECWTDVEQVIIASNEDAFQINGTKKLVVRIADPPKRGENSIGIKPRKLFIGQIPREVKESVVRELFEKYGCIEEFEVPKRLSAVSCAFVRYQKWCEAEAAIEALNEKFRFSQSKRALVVKFADAKLTDKDGNRNSSSQLIGEKRPLSPEDRYDCAKRLTTSLDGNQYSVDPLDMGFVASRMGLPMGLGSLPGMGRIDWIHEENHRFLTGMNGNLRMAMVSEIDGSHYTYDASYASVNQFCIQPERLQSLEMTMEDQVMVETERQLSENPAVSPGIREPPVGPNGKLGKGFTDPKVKEWTLFVGQIPHQADEYALWDVFSSFGEILELNVLRKDGKHRGCAFVTYATKQIALAAIENLDGSSFPWDSTQRKLVVRFREKGSKL